MAILLATLADPAVETLRRQVRELGALGENAPPLLRRVPVGILQARGVLLEAAVPYAEVAAVLAAAGGEGHPFTRARVLLFDAEQRWVGSMGLSGTGGDARWESLSDRGCGELADAIAAAEEFTDGIGATFEARLLVIQDLILTVLVLVPTASGSDLYVLPLPPTFGGFPEAGPPMSRSEFLRRLAEVWEEGRSLGR